MNTTTATNHEWGLSSHAQFVNCYSTGCCCDSRFGADSSVVVGSVWQKPRKAELIVRIWMALYRLKKRLGL